jgi:O-antigen ligase
MVAVGVIIFIRYPRLGILLALISLIFLRDIPAQIIATDEYSYTTRIIAWEIIWDEIVKVNPLLGLGPANYYFYTPMFPILGYSVEFNSHNNYVDIVAQIGLLGLACLLWFAAELGVLGLGLLKRPMDGFSKAYVFGVLGGLAGTLAAGMLGDWVIPFVYNIGVRGLHTSVIGWIFLGGLIVIERIYSAPRSQLQEVS